MAADVSEIRRIVELTTTVYRKGAALYQDGMPVESLMPPHGGLNVVESFGYPPIPDGADVIDMVAIAVEIDEHVENYKSELVSAIGDGVFEEYGSELSTGPHYIHLGAELGSQEYAL